MAPPRPKITLYVDTVSPFAYVAYHILRHNPAFQSCEIRYVPIFLGGLMHKCGNTAPMKIKNKDKWIGLERLRWARLFSVPMRAELPPDFPAMTLPIMRALCAVASPSSSSPSPSPSPSDEEEKSSQIRLTRALDTLFARYWVDHIPTHRAEELRTVLGEVFGEPEAERLLTAAATTGKQQLIANTDMAFDDGAFGLPWMVCTNAEGVTEGFWGVDHLGQVARFLGLDLELDKEKGSWKSLL